MSNAMPDVCKTPAPPIPSPIPIPYPNIADFSQANPGTCSSKVKIVSQVVVTKDTMIPMTSGDEAGVAGGVISGVIKGPAKAKTFSQKVKVEGKNVVFQTCTIAHSGSNANSPAGTHTAPSQTKVKVSG
jgi:hypothetical protein